MRFSQGMGPAFHWFSLTPQTDTSYVYMFNINIRHIILLSAR